MAANLKANDSFEPTNNVFDSLDLRPVLTRGNIEIISSHDYPTQHAGRWWLSTSREVSLILHCDLRLTSLSQARKKKSGSKMASRWRCFKIQLFMFVPELLRRVSLFILWFTWVIPVTQAGSVIHSKSFLFQFLGWVRYSFYYSHDLFQLLGLGSNWVSSL